VIYIVFALFLFALSYGTLGLKKLRRQLYFPVMLGLFVFSAFRFQVGCDWSGYYFQYVAADYVANDLIAGLSEPIWWIIVRWVKEQEFIYPTINVISSAIFFFGVHVLARKQPDPLAFLVLLFPILIINMPMSGIRQGAAIGLICMAFAAFIDRRPIRFAMLVLIAGGFHTSALVFMILVPLATGQYSRTRLLLAAVFALPGVVFLAGGLTVGLAVTRYIGDGIDAFGAIFRVGAIFLTAIYFSYFVSTKWAIKYDIDYNLVKIGSMGMALSLLLLPISSVIADRFAYYLIPIQAIIFARLPFIPFRSQKWIHVALPYLGLLTMLVGWTQTSSLFEQCYLPYQSWIFGMPAGDILKDGTFE
jgi:hypothetical protein